MINTRINGDRAVPWWAVILAPLVGVPAMVALLALAGPEQAAPIGETETGVTTEQVESEAVDRAFDRRAERLERLLRSC